MKTNQAWRDPNISLSMLTEKLGTNRTTLSKAIHDSGKENFSVYINEMRISDFISLMNSRKNISIKEAFFVSGYRSRTTALRNFKAIIGQIPSDYFGRNSDEVEW
jgi:AraC-like DNA-binding protein